MAAERKEMVQNLFKKLDTDGNGTISKDELQKAVDDRKSAAGKDAPTDGPSVDDLFKSADSNGDGGISADELLKQMSMGPPRGMQGAQGAPPPGGASPPAGGAAPAGASDQTDSSISSSKLSTDPADADGNGTVSAAERRAYEYKQLMAALAGAMKDATGATGATKASSSGQSADSVSVVV